MNISFILSRLWQYLNIYYLKPFDAINDTLTSYLIFQNTKFKKNYVEIGSGDGMFSYIMHGGKFSLNFDRYIDVDLDNQDIFDTHKKKININPGFKNLIRPSLSIDARANHVKKISEIGFSKKVLNFRLENLHLKKISSNFIFFYTAHGINNLEKCIKSSAKILKKNGKMVILVYDKYVEKHFVCYNIGKKKFFISNFFKKLDNGRYREISKYSRSLSDWEKLFKKYNLKVEKRISGLSGLAWKFYDIQSRPILKILIIFFNFFPKPLRTILKFFWMVSIFPFLLIFFALFSNLIINNKHNCYHVFQLQKK